MSQRQGFWFGMVVDVVDVAVGGSGDGGVMVGQLEVS